MGYVFQVSQLLPADLRVIGGYVFITNMIPLHALVLILMGRFSDRLYVAYSSWYAIGTLSSMQVPFVGFQPVSTSEHMGALGTYLLCVQCNFTVSNLPPQASSVYCKSLHLLNWSALMYPPSNSKDSLLPLSLLLVSLVLALSFS